MDSDRDIIVGDVIVDGTDVIIAIGDLMMAKDRSVDLCESTINNLGLIIYSSGKKMKESFDQ